jgi:hypothetical protein
MCTVQNGGKDVPIYRGRGHMCAQRLAGGEGGDPAGLAAGHEWNELDKVTKDKKVRIYIYIYI